MEVIAVLGDSWMSERDSWAHQVAAKVGCLPLVVAKPMSESGALPSQMKDLMAKVEAPDCTCCAEERMSQTICKCGGSETFGNALNATQRVDAAIIHSGGNDCLECLNILDGDDSKKPLDLFAGVCMNVGETARSLIKEMGVSFLMISDVPFTPSIPYIKEFIADSASDKGVDVAMWEAKARTLQEALNGEMSKIIQQLREEFPGTKIIHFMEVAELQKWSAKENMFDDTKLHPNREGHSRLCEAALRRWNEEGFPKGSANVAPVVPQTTPPSEHPLEGETPDDSMDEFDTLSKDVMRIKPPMELEDMLSIYGLYKQITVGDNKEPRPKMYNVKGRSKWAAWTKCRGLSKSDAKLQYIKVAKHYLKK